MQNYNTVKNGNIIKFINKGVSIQKGEIEMPSVRKRNDGRYEGRFYYGKRYSVYDNDPKKAEQKLRKLIKEVKAKEKQRTNINITLKEFYNFWLETYKKPFLKERSYKNLTIYFEKHILVELGNIKLQQLTSTVIQTFLNKLDRSRTKELVTTYLKSCLTKAKNLNYIKHDLFNEVIVEKKLKIKRNAFTYEQQVKILNVIKNTDIENYIMFYLLTGVRANELYKVVEINKEHNFIKVLCEKTDNKIKTIKIKNEVIELYEIILKEKMKTKTIYDKFKVLCQSVDINATIHQLRHTYATNNYYLGTPIKELQEWLGHSDIKMTMNIYTNVDYTLSKEKIKLLYNNLYYEF